MVTVKLKTKTKRRRRRSNNIFHFSHLFLSSFIFFSALIVSTKNAFLRIAAAAAATAVGLGWLAWHYWVIYDRPGDRAQKQGGGEQLGEGERSPTYMLLLLLLFLLLPTPVIQPQFLCRLIHNNSSNNLYTMTHGAHTHAASSVWIKV